MKEKIFLFIERHFIFIIALCLVLLKFLLWDYQYITELILPKHDGLHGMAAFATSLHSMRLDGEIAWWNPIDIRTGGWAQYYSGFLSPVAPTYGSVLFIIISYAVKILALAGVVIPEYYLYIFLNHFITPLLAIYFLLRFSSLFCKRKISYVIIGAGYLFTGIGLWVDSWYYWQDQMFMWLILYAVINLWNNISNKTYYFMVGSAICFLAAANYWTLHNILFILTVILLYIFSQEKGVSGVIEKFRNIGTIIFKNKIATLFMFSNFIIWIIIVSSVYIGQNSNYTRSLKNDIFTNGGYSFQLAFERAVNIPFSYLTLELFNPVVNAINSLDYNYIHCARYLGVALLPCIVFGIYRRNEKERDYPKDCVNLQIDVR